MKIIIGRGTVLHILDHFSDEGIPLGLCGEEGKRSICPVKFHGDLKRADTICQVCKTLYMKGGKNGSVLE